MANAEGALLGGPPHMKRKAHVVSTTRENQKFLDYLMAASRSDYYAVEVKGATHLDFTDDPPCRPAHP